jgi:transposase InsO family protein
MRAEPALAKAGVDTLFVNVRPDRPIKHFTAYDPVAKWTFGKVASTASARSAAALLDKLIAEAPFKIKAIQVDGGAEFRAEFEQACKDKGLALFVLPPKSPQINGAVERAQSSWRYEFYACYDLPAQIDKLQTLVDAFAHRFNPYRSQMPSTDRARRRSQHLQLQDPTLSYVMNPDRNLSSLRNLP